MCFLFFSAFDMESAAANRRPSGMSTKKQHHTLYGLDQSSQPPRNSPLLFAQADTAPGCIRCPACRPLNSDVRPKLCLQSRNVDFILGAVGSLRGSRTGSEMNSCHGGDEPPGPLEGTRRASRKLSGSQDFCFQS